MYVRLSIAVQGRAYKLSITAGTRCTARADAGKSGSWSLRSGITLRTGGRIIDRKPHLRPLNQPPPKLMQFCLGYLCLRLQRLRGFDQTRGNSVWLQARSPVLHELR